MKQYVIKISKEFRFRATHHILDRFGLGKHEEPHTHNYRLIVTIEGAVPENGMVMDFSDLKKIVEEHAVHKLAHNNLNEIFSQPSAEYIAIWIWERIVGQFPPHIALKKVELYETESSSVTYQRLKREDIFP